MFTVNEYVRRKVLEWAERDIKPRESKDWEAELAEYYYGLMDGFPEDNPDVPRADEIEDNGVTLGPVS